MKRKPKIPLPVSDSGDKVLWGAMAVIGVGAIIGGLMNLYDAGKEYGRREMLNRFKERNDGRDI